MHQQRLQRGHVRRQDDGCLAASPATLKARACTIAAKARSVIGAPAYSRRGALFADPHAHQAQLVARVRVPRNLRHERSLRTGCTRPRFRPLHRLAGRLNAHVSYRPKSAQITRTTWPTLSHLPTHANRCSPPGSLWRGVPLGWPSSTSASALRRGGRTAPHKLARAPAPPIKRAAKGRNNQRRSGEPPERV